MSVKPDTLDKEEHARILHEEIIPNSWLAATSQEHQKGLILTGLPVIKLYWFSKDTMSAFAADIPRHYGGEAKSRPQISSDVGFCRKQPVII